MRRKKIIEQVLRTKERYKDVKLLLKEKNYDEIFTKYGQNIYLKTVPNKVRKKDANNLFEQGRYEDIYRKHGYEKYKAYLDRMREVDVLTEIGNEQKSKRERIKYWFKIKMAPLLLSTALSVSAAPATLSAAYEGVKNRNAKEYAEDIEKYNEYIQKYAQEIKDMKLTDTQVFVKVVDDMWKEIKGYASPENEILGWLRLTLNKEGIGVCRNFADDITAKLNEINPEYNARNLVVYMKDNEYYLADIERNIIEKEETDQFLNINEENLNDIANGAGIKYITRKSCGDSCRCARQKYNINIRSN